METTMKTNHPDKAEKQMPRNATLFIAGKRDAWINPQKVSALREAAKTYKLPIEIVSYDADHAFFNDTRPAVYNAEAAANAWQRVLEHFRKHLGAGAGKGATGRDAGR